MKRMAVGIAVLTVCFGCLRARAAADGIELDNWKLQDATVVYRQAVKEGWFRENSAKQPEEGRVLSRNGFDDSSWYRATVPGTILTTLVNNKVYPEPLYDENNRPEKIPEDLCRKDWWYRTQVKVPESFKDRVIWLTFEGINYAAEIWVNGRIAGRMMGAFKRGRFDLARCDVKAGQEMTVAVRISPQPTVGVPSEHVMGSTGGPCGGVARLDGPTFGCSVGWDWLSGIRDRNSGIWRKVPLSATGRAVVGDPAVVTDLPNLPRLDTATVRIDVPVRNVTEKPVSGTLALAFDQVRLERRVTLAPWWSGTVSFTPAEEPQLTVANPRVWWPNGLGEPHLYRLDVTFTADGAVSDRCSVPFGIRTFSYFEPGNPNLALRVNGIRVFLRGGNWGLDEALKRADRTRIDHQVRMHREANLNFIRDWGGQSMSGDLADACDRHGILLWEEFWQFNSADPVNTDLYLANVRDAVLRLRNHPSIVLWCSRNEGTPPKYLDDAVRQILQETDPTRHYQPNSGDGYGFNSGGPYDWTPPTRLSRFYEDPNWNRRESFKTEIGGFSVPTIESLMAMFPASEWEGITDSWAEHNFCAAGGRKYPRFMTTRYGEPKNFPDFVRKAQLMNYEMHRAIYEGRIGRMFAPMQGVLLWMTIPAQPSLIWQMIPYDLDPHATYFGIRKACEPRHVFFNESADGGIVQVANHDPAPFAGSAQATFYNLDGSVAGGATWPVAVGGVSVATLGTVKWPENLSKVHFFELELVDAQRKRVSDNFYWHNRACNPAKTDDLRDDNRLVGYDDLKELNRLPQVTLEVASVETGQADGGQRTVTVELANNSGDMALMTHLQLRGKKSGKRILPATYSDNYFSIPPKKRRRVRIACAAADLKDDEPVVYLDGWNVTVAKGDRVMPNETASVSAPMWAHQKGFTFLPRPQMPQSVVRINCGGYTRGNFAQDPGFLEGWCGFQTEDMDLSETKMAGPPDIYRTVRWGESAYTCLMTATNHPHTVRLHWAEHSREKGPGKCRFDVKANGKVILNDFDAAGAAGGIWKGVVVELKHIPSDAEGKIVLEFVNGKRLANEQRDARINGIEVIPE